MVSTFSTLPGSPDEKLIIELKKKAKKEFISFSDLVMAAIRDKYKDTGNKHSESTTNGATL